MSKRRSKSNNQKNHDLLPYKTIRAASTGDPDAVNTVPSHYANYITHMSMRKLYDEHGNVYLCVDETMRRRLEIKLITGILAFRAA